jgi:hypothetical protein
MVREREMVRERGKRRGARLRMWLNKSREKVIGGWQ